ncbi:amidohydrolase family protein [Candidatus Poriferisocius sp.]|uniref:amidohydrolase family protein n=1 Tax=Candidatus Poriferisocius sp. TaxID=3101276 RepID=UPI003B01C8A8
MGASSEISVFDVHHHVGDASGALGLPPEQAPDPEAYAARELAKRLEIMGAGGVDQAAVIPGHGYLRPNGHADTQAANDRIATYRDASPDRFPVAIGIVEPRDGDISLAELERAAGPLGLAGMSFHTRFQGVSIDNHWVSAYVGAMGELGLLPLIHALDETAEESLWKVGQLASRHPTLTMLVLDGYATHEGTKHCGHLAATHPNLVFDCSLSYNFDFIANHVRQYGAHRYVYGTDLYSWPLGRRISHILGQLLESDLSDEDKTAVAGDNARRLFGLDTT